MSRPTLGNITDSGWVNPLALMRLGKHRYRKYRRIKGAIAVERCIEASCPYIDDGYCTKWGPWEARRIDDPYTLNSLWKVRGYCCFLSWYEKDGEIYEPGEDEPIAEEDSLNP